MKPSFFWHRRTSQRGWGLHPPRLGLTIIFWAKAKFFGQKPAAKNEKIFILSNEIKCSKSGIFTNKYWVGQVGQSNFASEHKFSRVLSKIFFSGKDGSAP